jgi:hypothetical protein
MRFQPAREALSVRAATGAARVFSSEADAGSREENTIKQKDRVSSRFNPNRKDSRDNR